MGIRYQSHGHVARGLTEQVTDQGGLACTDFPRYYVEPCLVHQAIVQQGQCHAVFRAEIKETRIRENGERLFAKAVKSLIHVQLTPELSPLSFWPSTFRRPTRHVPMTCSTPCRS